MRLASRTSATDCLQANRRVWNVIQTELFRTNKEARIKEVTGLLHISDRLLAGELSRVEAARGALQSLPIDINVAYLEIARETLCPLGILPDIFILHL
ncbi:MAG: hypothetical protein GX451_05505 [Acholeplasmataceae bacterium]|nr:hypothetical protein [Acholeplasmataceae bacterium]